MRAESYRFVSVLNRPVFAGGCFVSIMRRWPVRPALRNTVLHFGWWAVAYGFEKPWVVDPIGPSPGLQIPLL